MERNLVTAAKRRNIQEGNPVVMAGDKEQKVAVNLPKRLMSHANPCNSRSQWNHSFLNIDFIDLGVFHIQHLSSL